jgi:hypothetical protein
LAEILFGKVNPSGKLPVTFERRITANPAYATFPNPVNQHPTEIAYSEGLYVGYRGGCPSLGSFAQTCAKESPEHYHLMARGLIILTEPAERNDGQG